MLTPNPQHLTGTVVEVVASKGLPHQIRARKVFLRLMNFSLKMGNKQDKLCRPGPSAVPLGNRVPALVAGEKKEHRDRGRVVHGKFP